MRSLKARAASLAGMALTAAVVVGVDAAPASAHITDPCRASTDWIIDFTPAQDRVFVRSTKCVHRSTIVCANASGAQWRLTDAAATASNAYNVNVCRAANPYLVGWEIHSY